MNKKTALISILILPFLVSCVTKGVSGSSRFSSNEASFSQESSEKEDSSHREESKSESSSNSIESSSGEGFSSELNSSSDQNSSSTQESTSSQESSSTQEPSSSSHSLSLSEAMSRCLALDEEVNEAGYFRSDEVVSFEAKVLTIVDSVCTKKYYNESNRYKALVSDGDSLAYVALNEAMYKSMKDYAGASNSVYRFKAYLGKYYSSPEFIALEASWLNKTLDHDYDYSSLSLLSLSEIQNEIASLPISEKGFSYGTTIRFQATYIDELVQEVLLFSDGDKTIQLHGDSKISNSFSKGNRYEIVANLGLYQYKPSLEFVAVAKRLDGADTLPTPSEEKASSQYSITYQKDKKYHQSKYENEFYATHEFTGYVNAFVKNDSYTFVLIDEYKETSFTTKETARAGKALFVNNDSERDVYGEKKLNYSKLYEYALENKRIKVTYSPYLYHTESYWMVFCHFSALVALD